MVPYVAVMCMLLHWLLLLHHEQSAANVVVAVQFTVVAYSTVELFKSHRRWKKAHRELMAAYRQAHDELCGCGTFPHDRPEA
jgi:hypothetical protein